MSNSRTLTKRVLHNLKPKNAQDNFSNEIPKKCAQLFFFYCHFFKQSHSFQGTWCHCKERSYNFIRKSTISPHLLLNCSNIQKLFVFNCGSLNIQKLEISIMGLSIQLFLHTKWTDSGSKFSPFKKERHTWWL